MKIRLIIFPFFIVATVGCTRYPSFQSRLSPITAGWSKTAVNGAIFRNNSIVSHDSIQYVAFYDSAANVVLAKREIGSDQWMIRKTTHKGNASDAHNVINIMIDGDGYLHMAWDQHDNTLNYCKSIEPGSLEMDDKEPMIGHKENYVTYPEFYWLPSGDLIFVYRDGSSGNGNMIMNRYSVRSKKWTRVHDNLISGQGMRNAYWQLYISKFGAIHISWIWRDNFQVETNHDLCYAVSYDEGTTWSSSDGKIYSLPITAENAEYAAHIPQGSDLINQTSMVVSDQGIPFIATYFQMKSDSCPQYYVVYKAGDKWELSKVSKRKTDFDLGGSGTRSIPISRPKILYYPKKHQEYLFMIYRDEENNNNACMAVCDADQLKWRSSVIFNYPLDRWEPSYDTQLWRNGLLHLFVQKVGQDSGERSVELPPQLVYIMEVTIH